MLWSKYVRISCILLLSLFFSVEALCQHDSAASEKVKLYRMHVKYELPAAVVALGASSFGFQALDRSSAFDPEDVARLDPADINRFDRPAAFKDPALFEQSHKTSDLFLNISILSPVLLMLDKQMRQDWLDLLTLYLVSHTVDNALYFAAAFPIRRARPLTYNEGLTMEEKTGVAKSNSFFSGHVSFAATSTFFLAKVLTDYKQIRGWKRIAIFSAAAVPPALVGHYRMRAGKHFRTDVITGFLIGAGTGIVVPQLHKSIRKSQRMSLSPFYGTEQSGFTLSVKL